MLLLNPRCVVFDGTVIDDVTLVAIDRSAERVAIEWTDRGPYPAFVDVPEQRVVIKVIHELARGELNGPAIGAVGPLSLRTSPAAADAGRRRLDATVVVTHLTHDLSRKKGSLRTIECIAISASGQSDPISITEAEG